MIRLAYDISKAFLSRGQACHDSKVRSVIPMGLRYIIVYRLRVLSDLSLVNITSSRNAQTNSELTSHGVTLVMSFLSVDSGVEIT